MPRDTSSSGRTGMGGSFSGGGSSRSSGGSRSGGGGSLRGADGMTASQRAATRDSRLGLTTGTTWRGNTAVGPAGGRATGFTNVSTGGGRMTKTQRDAVGPGTMPRVTSGQPSRSRVTAQPTSGPRPMVKTVRPAAKKPAVKRPPVNITREMELKGKSGTRPWRDRYNEAVGARTNWFGREQRLKGKSGTPDYAQRIRDIVRDSRKGGGAR